MSKKEEFKIFASKHPELVSHIKSGSNTWQDLYEIYDIYGDKNEAWQEYFTKNTNNKNASSLGSITDIIKKADLNSIQKHIGTAQKAIGLFQELTTKDTVAGAAAGALGAAVSKGPTTSRPINKFFED